MGLELLTRHPSPGEPGCPGDRAPSPCRRHGSGSGSHSGSPPLPGQAGSPRNSLGPERARPSRRARAPPDPDRGPAAPLRAHPSDGKGDNTPVRIRGPTALCPLAAPTATVPARPASPNSARNLIAQQPGCSGARRTGPARPSPGEARWGHRSRAASPQGDDDRAHLPPSRARWLEPSPADHRHPAGRREPWGRHGPRGARRDSCGARHPGTGSARPAAAAGPRGLARGWGAGGASTSPRPAGAQGSWRGCGASGTVGGAGGELRTGRGGGSGWDHQACGALASLSPERARRRCRERHVDGSPVGELPLRTLVTHFVLVSSLLNPQSPCTRRGTPPDQDKARPLKEPPNLPLEFPSRVKTAPRPGAGAQAPLLGSHCRQFRGRPAFLHRGGQGPGALGWQTGGLGAGGCPPHWKAWSPLPEAELVSLPGGGSVPAPPRALFGNRAEERAARAWDHAVSAAPERGHASHPGQGSAPAETHDPDRQGPSSVFPRPNGKRNVRARAVSQVIGQH